MDEMYKDGKICRSGSYAEDVAWLSRAIMLNKRQWEALTARARDVITGWLNRGVLRSHLKSSLEFIRSSVPGLTDREAQQIYAWLRTLEKTA